MSRVSLRTLLCPIPHSAFASALTRRSATEPELLDIDTFGCKYAYTVDGGPIGELEWECFNAAEVTVRFEGQSIHPGDAKGRMVNAGNLFCDFNALLPYVQRPEYTESYEGFYHLEGVSATVDHATARYIVRDHDAAKFQQKLDLIDAAASMLNQRLGEERVTVEIKQQYRNMAEIVRDYPELIDVAKEAYLACGVEPQVLPIRGGTDGAQLSFRGLPCPNAFPPAAIATTASTSSSRSARSSR